MCKYRAAEYAVYTERIRFIAEAHKEIDDECAILVNREPRQTSSCADNTLCLGRHC